MMTPHNQRQAIPIIRGECATGPTCRRSLFANSEPLALAACALMLAIAIIYVCL
jgi:hypothetical protein